MIAVTELLEALPAAIYMTDSDGRITFYNAAAADIWGCRPENGTYFSGSWRLFWPDGRPMAHEDCPMAVALREGRSVRGVEAILEKPDGTRVRFVPYPTPLRSDDGTLIGAINLLVDTTQLRQVEVDSARLAAIVTSSDDAIISKTLDGVITSWNASATRIFGYEPEEVVGRPITILIPPELIGEEMDILARLRRGERTDHFDTVRIAKDGRRVHISLTVSPVRDSAGNIVGASKVARDVTERKQSEHLQRLLLEELNHRVKNTLATVQAVASQSLKNSASQDRFVEGFAGRIQALARAHEVLMQTKMQDASLTDIIREQVVLGAVDGARISCSGPLVHVDAQVAMQLALVLHELATNARMHGALSTPNGRLSIRWTLLMEGAGEIYLEWTERGVPNIVAPVTRGFGTELIEHSLASCGGGAKIRFGPEGLICELRVPLHEATRLYDAFIETAAEKANPSLSKMAERSDLQGKRILVVEDEPLISMEIESNLERAGCEVIGPAGTIEMAESLLAQRELDAALLDANLAGRPVDDFAAALAKKGIPFAFATGYGRDALPSAFRDATVLAKPFTADQMMAAIQGLFAGRSRDAGVVVLRPKGAQPASAGDGHSG